MWKIVIVTHIQYEQSYLYRNHGHRDHVEVVSQSSRSETVRQQQRKPAWARNRIKDKSSLKRRAHPSVAFIVLGIKKKKRFLHWAHEQELPVSAHSLNHVTVTGEPDAPFPWHHIVLIAVYLSQHLTSIHRYFSEQLVRHLSLMVLTFRTLFRRTPLQRHFTLLQSYCFLFFF